LTGVQPRNILIRHLLSCEFGDDPAFVEEFGYPCLVCRWELGGQRWNRRSDASFDIIVLCPVRNSELFESWGERFRGFGTGQVLILHFERKPKVMQYLFRVALALSSARFKNMVASSYLKISLETWLDIRMKGLQNPPWVCACAVVLF
jgi:hypothetical protein